MFHMYIFWKWLTLFFVSSTVLEESSNTISVTGALDLLAVLFLIVGIVAFFLMRRLRSTNARVVSTQVSMRQLRAASIALPTFLSVPVIVLLLVWLGASSLPPIHPLNPFPTVYVTEVVRPPTPNPLFTAIAHDLVDSRSHFLTIGTDPSYPPQTYLDNNTISGSDIDIITAIAKKMGLNWRIVPMNYADRVNNLNNHQIDVAISAIPLTQDLRSHQKTQQEDYTTIGNVSYLQPLDDLVVPGENAGGFQFTGLNSLCGHKVSVLSGSSEEAALTSVRCGHNNPTLTIDKQASVNLAIDGVISNSAEAAYIDDPTARYSIKNNANYQKQVQILGSVPGLNEVMLTSSQAEPAMALAIQAAFNLIVADHTYCNLLKNEPLKLTADQLQEPVSCS